MTPAPTRSRRLPGQIRSPPFKLLLTIINFYADMSFDSSSKIFDCRPPLPAPHNFPRSFRYIVTALHLYLTIASCSCPDPVGVAALNCFKSFSCNIYASPPAPQVLQTKDLRPAKSFEKQQQGRKTLGRRSSRAEIKGVNVTSCLA